MFRYLTVAALFVADCATSIPASSRLGSRLLSTARRLNNNNNNQNDDAEDFTWVSDYSIRFDSCHTTLSFRAEGGGGSADGEDMEPTESMRLVHFKLCPTNGCSASSCKNGADYLVEMREFVEAYLDFQLTQKEYNCEKVENNCDCENANDDQACLTQCYATAGLDYCQQDQQNQYNNGNNNYNAANFEVDRYLECEQLNNGGDDDSTAVYVGAYCSNNGKAIHLGTFTDRQCTKTTSTSTFSSLMGFDLPYTSESLVSNDCISCLEPTEYDDDYNADGQDADTVVEICEELYQRSAKCEGNLNHQYTQYTGGCNYMHKILPQMERMIKNNGRSASVVWAWMFATTTLLMTAYAMYLYRKLSRGKVNLSTQ